MSKGITIWPVKPYKMIIAGPSNCGKTRFLLNTLIDTYAKDKFSQIFIFAPAMSINQTDYKSLEDKYGDAIVKHEGLPTEDEASEIFTAIQEERDASDKYNALFIVDDLMGSVNKGKFLQNVMTAASHHLGISIIFLQQKHFVEGSGRTARLNCDYFVAFQLHSDKASFGRIAKSIEPEHWKELMAKFEKITSKPYCPLIIDFKSMYQNWPSQYHYRDGWWDKGIKFDWSED